MTPQLVADLTTVLFALVALFKGFVPEGPKQNTIIRAGSSVLGALLFAVALVATGQPVTQETLLAALNQGFLVGAGLTTSVKVAKVAASKAATVKLTLSGRSAHTV